MEILAAFAHPDDETRFLGGTLAEVIYNEESLHRAWLKGESDSRDSLAHFLQTKCPEALIEKECLTTCTQSFATHKQGIWAFYYPPAKETSF
jgi:hypothetical protein